MSDSQGETALFHAVRVGKLESVRALLKAGANLEVANLEGKKVTDLPDGVTKMLLQEFSEERYRSSISFFSLKFFFQEHKKLSPRIKRITSRQSNDSMSSP